MRDGQEERLRRLEERLAGIPVRFAGGGAPYRPFYAVVTEAMPYGGTGKCHAMRFTDGGETEGTREYDFEDWLDLVDEGFQVKVGAKIRVTKVSPGRHVLDAGGCAITEEIPEEE